MRYSIWFLAAVCAAPLLSGPAFAADNVSAKTPPGTVFKDCADCPDMVVIPPGSNEIGSDASDTHDVMDALAKREMPKHKVTIARPFALGRYEVTRAEYEQFSKDTKRPIDPTGCAVHDPATDIWINMIPGYNWQNPGFPQAAREPVVCMSWTDAHDFAAWMAKKTGKKYRLPSEAEWEYAARAGTKTTRYWGDGGGPGADYDTVCDHMQMMNTATIARIGPSKHFKNNLVCVSDNPFTMAVGSFAPNQFGLYDMLGNALEMMEDCYHEGFIGAPTDGSAWADPNCKAYVAKGGAFVSAPMLARAASRGPNPTNFHHMAMGIRLARDVE